MQFKIYLGLTLAIPVFVTPDVVAQKVDFPETRVIVESDGWKLAGTLMLPQSEGRIPAVLMLNQAAGDRTVYAELARCLGERAVASLRLDLRGHGESTNLGRFVPGEVPRSPLIWDAEADVIAAYDFLKKQASIDPQRIAIVGASYSGEEMAEAGRLGGFASAYVALSPGSFSDESIAGIDSSRVPWLFVVSRDEPHLKKITASVQRESETVELLILPGSEHATRLLEDHTDLAERIGVWLSHHLTLPLTPGPRYGHELVFDETRNETILFGGFGPDGLPMNDTWRWDGRSWRLLSQSGPVPRKWPAMVYDSRRRRAILFGGRNGARGFGTSLSDTWAWDGKRWRQLSSSGPSARDHHRMAYDRRRDRIVLFGGWDGTKVVGDTWEWDGESWIEMTRQGPLPRAAFGLEYNQETGMVVLMGGQNADGPLGDTWTWDGREWLPVDVDGPGRRSFHAMTYDPTSSRVLLVGGRDRDYYYSDVWAWQHGAWVNLDGLGPERRGIYAAAFDPLRGMVLFHGSGERVDESWQLDGSTWAWSDSLGWLEIGIMTDMRR